MKILLFGASGQLGHEINSRALDLEFEMICPVQSELDISEEAQVLFLAERSKPDLIINAAAYTAVDQAESERDLAFAVNRDGAAAVARAAKRIGSRMIHISTDYVFSGEGNSPLREDSPTAPLNVYGLSKLEGEQAVLSILGQNALIVRTSSLHGRHGVNFVHTMIKLFKERESVSVVRDQVMSPCWAGWLAEVVLDLGRIAASGVVHASCAGAVSWYDFAQAILESVQGKDAQARRCRLEPIGADQFARPARRPRYSVLDCSRLAQLLGRKPISWQEGLRAHLAELGYEQR
ncbi:MAG: dTDP-4-dehydrorhamnose reductase [Oligoflexia bacterium]|nr:dTDP-4-dehydrorhamnose reductase [Oligoflexia bacterium]